MQAILGVVLVWFTRYFIISVFKYVFAGFLGLVSYGFMQRLINRYINTFLNSLMQTENVGIIMNLSRLDDAISIIIGAMTICVAIKAMGIKITGLTG